MHVHRAAYSTGNPFVGSDLPASLARCCCCVIALQVHVTTMKKLVTLHIILCNQDIIQVTQDLNRKENLCL